MLKLLNCDAKVSFMQLVEWRLVDSDPLTEGSVLTCNAVNDACGLGSTRGLQVQYLIPNIDNFIGQGGFEIVVLTHLI